MSMFDQCEICLQLYRQELELRCAGCDRPRCPFCVSWVRTTWTCVSCHTEEGKEAKEDRDGRAYDVEG